VVLSSYIDQSSPSAVWHSLFSALAFKDMAMDDGSVTATLPALDDFRQNRDSGLAPAWLTVALDTLLGMAVFGKIMKAVPIATVDLTTDFPAMLTSGSDAEIHAACDIIAGNTAFVTGTIHDSVTGDLVARASAKFIIKAKPQKEEKGRKAREKAIEAAFDISGAAPTPLFDEALTGHPYANWMGIQQLKREGLQLIHLPFSELIIGDPFARTIHGGMLASIMEMAAAGTIIDKMGRPDLLAPLSTSINYLKRTFAGDCFAAAEIVRFGRNIIVAHARAWQQADAEPVATATILFKGLETEGGA